MKKLFGKLVPHSLTIQQKLNRKQISQRNLKRFKQNQTDFVRRFITMDETWIYHHENWNKNVYSGLKLVLQPQNRWSQNDRQKRLWHQLLGMQKGFCWLNILKKVKQLTLNIIATFWTSWIIFVKKDPVYRRKQSFFIKRMHVFTQVFWRWLNWTN